jgi:hypothetical protein
MKDYSMNRITFLLLTLGLSLAPLLQRAVPNCEINIGE